MMIKKIVIATIYVILLLGVGTATYFVLSATSNSDSQTGTGSGNDQPVFSFTATKNLSYSATIRRLDSQGNPTHYRSTIEYASSGDMMMVPDPNDPSPVTIYYVGGDTIVCDNEECSRQSGTNGIAELIEQVTFDDEKIAAIRQNAVHNGKEMCGTNICDVWISEDNATTQRRYLLDTQQRLIQAKYTSSLAVTVIDYEYRDIKIVAPKL